MTDLILELGHPDLVVQAAIERGEWFCAKAAVNALCEAGTSSGPGGSSIRSPQPAGSLPWQRPLRLRRGLGTSRTALCDACTSTVPSGRVMVTGPAGGWL